MAASRRHGVSVHVYFDLSKGVTDKFGVGEELELVVGERGGSNVRRLKKLRVKQR